MYLAKSRGSTSRSLTLIYLFRCASILVTAIRGHIRWRDLLKSSFDTYNEMVHFAASSHIVDWAHHEILLCLNWSLDLLLVKLTTTMIFLQSKSIVLCFGGERLSLISSVEPDSRFPVACMLMPSQICFDLDCMWLWYLWRINFSGQSYLSEVRWSFARHPIVHLHWSLDWRCLHHRITYW